MLSQQDLPRQGASNLTISSGAGSLRSAVRWKQEGQGPLLGRSFQSLGWLARPHPTPGSSSLVLRRKLLMAMDGHGLRVGRGPCDELLVPGAVWD